MPENSFVCRCEDVTLQDVRDLINEGINTVDEIKRICRCGMGPCGGKTCSSVIINEIAKSSGVRPAEVKPGNFRPPSKNVKLGLLAKAGEES